MDGFGLLVAIVSFVLALVALNKLAKVETKLAQIKLQLGNAIEELSRLRRDGLPPVTSPEPLTPAEAPLIAERPAIFEEVVLEPAEEASPEEIQPALSAEPEADNWLQREATPEAAPVAVPPVQRRDMEQALASRWFVWIGGVAIAIGGLLFIKYAYDNNLIPPSVQIVLGLLLGGALVAAGEFVRRKSVASMEQGYVPAALSAGGIVTAFGSIYAAYALYELISPLLAFGGLAAVALGAMALSRLQGPLIAALGLIGSYVTPALIPSEHPSAWGFFPYLLVILIASFATLRGRDWWWLGYAAIAGSAAWTALWLLGRPFEAADIWPVGLFAHALGLVAFYGIAGLGNLRDESGGLRPSADMSEPLFIGLFGLAVEAIVLGLLVHQAQHATLAIALFMVAMAGLSAIAWKKAGLDVLAPIALALSLIALMSWRDVAFHQMAMDESGLWSSIPGAAASEFQRWMLLAGIAFTAIGCLGVRMKADAMLWGGLAAVSSVAFVCGAWGRVDTLLEPTTWALIGAAFALVLLAVAYLGRERHDAEPRIAAASGVLSAGAAVLLVFAADRWFDQIWLTLAIAALTLLFAFLAGRMRVVLQGSVAAALGSLVTLRLFVSRHLWLDDRTLPWGSHWLLYGYGVPAIMFLLGSRLLRTAGYVRSAMSLEGLSLGLVISLASLEIRVLIGGGVTAEHPGLLEMSAHILTWLGAAYGLMYRQRIYSSFIAAWGARVLLGVSVVAIFMLSLLSLNPVISGDMLRGGMVFNTLLLAYLAPAVLLYLIARSLSSLNLESLRPFAETLAVGLVAVYLSLQLKRFYQGAILTAEPKDELEAALHVIIWLGLALLLVYRDGLLTAQALRWSARGLVGLAVFAIVAGAFVAFNPAISGLPVRGNAVFNSLLFAYVAPIPLLALLSLRLDKLAWSDLRPAAGALSLVLVFAYVTLETKRVFQGPTMELWSRSVAESYAYSAVWLALALALFVAGLRLSRQYVRYAGLGVMVLVVLKVFLLDMSKLEGLYRIASFIGLGLCLVGIGWLYQRFVQPPKDASA